MTYTEFRDKYRYQWIDEDGAYGCQCWDLAQRYFTECLGLPSWVLSGCGYVSSMLYPPKRDDLNCYFDEVDIRNMEQGDVCIWDEPTPHIAIYDSYNGYECWYFSQNPNPCDVITCNLSGTLHAFRLRKEEPTPPIEVVSPVEPNEEKNQIEIREGITEIRVRTTPSQDGEIIGKVQEGKYYDYYEMVDADGYNWYRIADSQWIAYSDEWEILHPAKPKEEYVKLEEYVKEYGYVIDIKNLYIKK